MKKIFLVLTIFILFYAINVNAKTIFTASSTSAKVNDVVEVKVNMDKDSSLEYQALGIRMRYDGKSLSFVKCEINGFEDVAMNGCKNNNNSVTFYAISISSTVLMNYSGNLYNVYFKVKNTNDSEIPIVLDVTDYSKDLENNYPFDVIGGKITIKNDSKKEESSKKANIKKSIDKNDFSEEDSDNKISSNYAINNGKANRDNNEKITKDNKNSKNKSVKNVNKVIFFSYLIFLITLIIVGFSLYFNKKNNSKS